jgi:hypothetical protein
MKTCQSCGGIIGEDCFNTVECAQIRRNKEAATQKKAENARVNIKRLNGAVVFRCSECKLGRPKMNNCFRCFTLKM